MTELLDDDRLVVRALSERVAVGRKDLGLEVRSDVEDLDVLRLHTDDASALSMEKEGKRSDAPDPRARRP